MVELKTSHKLAAGLVVLLLLGSVAYLALVHTSSQQEPDQYEPVAHLSDNSSSNSAPTNEQQSALPVAGLSPTTQAEQPRVAPSSVTSLGSLVRLPATSTPPINTTPPPPSSQPEVPRPGPVGVDTQVSVTSAHEPSLPPQTRPEAPMAPASSPAVTGSSEQSVDVTPIAANNSALPVKPVESPSEPGVQSPIAAATPSPPSIPPEASPSPPAVPSTSLVVASTPAPQPQPAITPTLVETIEEQSAWERFKTTYNRSYASPEEDLKRHAQFLDNLRFINTFNQQSNSLFSLGINHFADKSRDEINTQFIGPLVAWSNFLGQLNVPAPPPIPILQDTSVSDHVDWRKSLTSDVYDQGTCRDSAVFATVSALEAARSISNSVPPQIMSLRQLFECIDLKGFPTCQGLTTIPQVLDLVRQQPAGLVTSDAYEEYLKHTPEPGNRQCGVPQTADSSFTLEHSSRVRLQSFAILHKDNMMEAIISNPLLVALDASQSTFHFYQNGLYHDSNCSGQVFNQNALLVAHLPAGDAGMPFEHLVIRNSFGKDWGMSGYMRMLKDETRNKCLPQQLAFMPVL